MKEKNGYLIFLLGLLFIFWSINSFLKFNSIHSDTEVGWYGTIPLFTREAIFKYHQFPHWIPNYHGGVPFFGNAPNMIFNIPTLLYMAIPNLQVSLYIETLLQMLLGTIFIYYLMVYLNLKPKFAVISSIIFIFNTFYARKSMHLGDDWANLYFWIPIIFLFCLKSLKSKESKKFVKYAILTGFFLALQFHAGNPQIFLYTTVVLFLYFIFHITIEGFSLAKIKKMVIMGLIIVFVLVGLSAIKLFPLLEFGEHSMLKYGRDFEGARGSYLEIDGIRDLVKPIRFLSTKTLNVGSVDQISIGIVGFILVILSFLTWKNRYVIFFSSATIILFLIATNSLFFYPLWKFWPGFSEQHHIGRILYLVPFLCAYLAGKGASNLLIFIKKKAKLKKWFLGIVYICLILVLLVNIGYFRGKETRGKNEFDLNEAIENHPLSSYLEKDKDIFRVHYIKTDYIGGTSASLYGIPHGIQILNSIFNVWVPEYQNEYIFGYLRFSPLKFYGMLNTKYLYSDEPVNMSELTLVKKFEECEECEGHPGYPKEYSQYLYLNNLYLPRAYIANNSILIIGDNDQAKEAMYLLMLNNNFDPSNTVIIIEESNITYNFEYLNNFNLILFLNSEVYLENKEDFERYVREGGILLPNITKEKKEISREEIDEIMNKFNNDYQNIKKANISFYSPNKIKINLKEKDGFLVLSEKFFMFEGWKATINNKNKEILRANGINSAIYIEDVEKNSILTIEYKPKSFKIGAIISIITLFLIIIALVILAIKKTR